MRFVDLNNGYTYNGDYPYIHWFDDNQSTNLVYTKKLCIIDSSNTLKVDLNSNMFRLLDMSQLATPESINDFSYYDISPLYTNTLTLIGEPYGSEYVYMIYISSSSEVEGEFVEDLYINDVKYNIGASFHPEYEPHKINLSNFGVEFPESIQKAFYETNVHEEEVDNITLNRKRKELLLEYWDIIASKGSYKSLYDALKWFEYDNLLSIKEFWKHGDRYMQEDLNSLMNDKIKQLLADYSKTTYIGLYLSLYGLSKDDNGKQIYDSEKNPALEHITRKWSVEDLSLKMCLLGNFYETYFMPIHLDLIHSTVEHIVFTSTIKILQDAYVSRRDFVTNIYCFDCNIKNGDVFFLEDVKGRVNNSTTLGSSYGATYKDTIIIGVDDEVTKINDEEELKTFMSQYYNGIGAIIPFECTIGEPIKNVIISIKKDNTLITNNTKLVTSNDPIKFNLLCQNEGEYVVNLCFETTSGKYFTRTIKFVVVDNTGHTLKVYKIVRGKPSGDQLAADNYVFTHTRNSSLDLVQQVLYSDLNKNEGIGLQRTIVYEGDIDPAIVTFITSYGFDYYTKEDEYGVITYTMFIYQNFGLCNTSIFDSITNKKIRDDYSYFPSNHHLEEIGGDKLEDYMINSTESIMVVPDVKYLKYITNEPEWVFENASTKEIVDYRSIMTPNVTYKEHPLTPGYYNIKFRYILEDDIYEISLDSAFIITQ